MSSEVKSSAPEGAELIYLDEPDYAALAHMLYLALQAVTSCPHGCKCCQKHMDPAIQALMAYINRWRE